MAVTERRKIKQRLFEIITNEKDNKKYLDETLLKSKTLSLLRKENLENLSLEDYFSIVKYLDKKFKRAYNTNFYKPK